MAKIKLSCKSCGKEVEREEKPEPKNKLEAKQILFNCPHCGATNLRDGSAYYAGKKKIKKPAKEPVKDIQVIKETKLEPERSEETNDETSEESPLII